jgi:hypothetical protein
VLRRRGPVLELRVNGVHVMDTAETGSEIELARAALRTADSPVDVLIGGLGLGFTAHEVLADSRVKRLVVVELEEVLVAWMRDGTIPHGPGFLADERLQVKVADVRVALAESPPGPTTWCCSMSTTGRTTSSTRQTPRSTSGSSWGACVTRSSPVGCW